MKHFFKTLFGGLVVFLLLAGGAKLMAVNWNQLKMPSFISTIYNYKPGPTTVDGDASLNDPGSSVRYTAEEEEDVIDSAYHTIQNGQTKNATTTISAKGYIIKDISNNKVIAENNSLTLMPIASLTKLITAVIAKTRMSNDERINISASVMKTYGNTADFKEGETIMLSDLMYPLLMVSSNDAAEAIARAYGRKDFIKEMNMFTQSIGAYRTYLVDPAGLSPENRSTATDLAIILNWIRRYRPEVLEIAHTKSWSVRTHTWVNPTHFLNWSNYLGGKNGFLPEADRTAASLFNIGSSTNIYAVVVLGSKMRDNDTIKLLEKAKAVMRTNR